MVVEEVLMQVWWRAEPKRDLRIWDLVCLTPQMMLGSEMDRSIAVPCLEMHQRTLPRARSIIPLYVFLPFIRLFQYAQKGRPHRR